MGVADLPPIPDKLFFKIGEVSRLVGVKPHVLRFWEGEFSQIRPTKAANGHRLYARGDVEKLRRIRTLLHERRFTIAGVRALLNEGSEAVEAALALRPSEAALEADELSEKVADLERRLEAVQAELEAARRAVADARAEAEFWRAQAQAASGAPRDVVDRVRDQVRGLRAWAEEG